MQIALTLKRIVWFGVKMARLNRVLVKSHVNKFDFSKGTMYVPLLVLDMKKHKVGEASKQMKT